MKTLKKLFSVSAIVALLGTLAPMYAFGAGNSLDLDPEFPQAYAYAYANGITTQSEDNADMGGKLTRIALAKMIAKYAINVLKLTPDTSKTCNFTDVTAALDAQYDNGVTQACQLGLMGVNITAFRPNDLVTRGEFGTTFSRALNANSDNLAAMNAADPYYKEHLNYLNKEGIMKVIDPNMLEVRGYVMLMMMRSDDSYEPSTAEGCSAEELLACFNADDYDACIAACSDANEPEDGEEEEEVKAGVLKVTGENPDYTSIPAAGLVSFGTLKLTATDEDVTVRSISFKKSGGLGTLASSTKIFLEKDGVRITGKAGFTNNVAVVTFTTPLVVKSTEKLDIVLSLAETAAEEFQFTTTEFNSSAEKVNGSYTTALLTTTSYSVVALTGSAVGTDANVKVDASKVVELGDVTFNRAGTKSATVKSITLNNSGSSSLNYLENISLYRDGEKVSSKATVNGKTLTFVLDDEIKTTDSNTVTYTVKAAIANADRVNDTFQLYIKNVEDLNVVETDTNFRATITFGTRTTLALITIKGSDLKFAETTTSAIKVVPGDKKVKFYEGTIESSEALTLTKLTVTMDSSLKDFDKVLDNLYVKIGDAIVAADEIIASGHADFVFDQEFTVNGKVNFSVYGDIKSDAEGTVINNAANTVLRTSFQSIKNANGENIGSSMGSISSRKVTIATAAVTLSNTSATTKNVQRGDTKVELGNLAFSTTSDVNAKLSSFKGELGAQYGDFDGATVTVYNGNTLVASDTIVAGSNKLTFSFDSMTIEKGTPVEFTVKLDKVPATVSGGNQMTILFTGAIVKANNKDVPVVGVNGTTLKVVAGGEASVVSQAYTNKLVLQGETTELGSLKLKATNGDVVMTSLTLTGMNTSKVSNVTLVKNGSAIATFIKSGDNFVVDGLSEIIELGNTSTYVVKGTISRATTSGDLLPVFTTKVVEATFESPYGAPLASITNENISATITTVTDVIKVTKVEPVKGSNFAALKITFNSDREVAIKADSLTVSSGSNLTTFTPTLKVGSSVNGDQYNAKKITIDGETVVYATLAGITWATTNGTPQVTIGLEDFDMIAIFDDASEVEFAGMLTNYRDSVTELTDLGANIQ